MIFVTVGTDRHPFERALDVIGPLAPTERIVVQHGATPARREWSNTLWLEFVDYERQLDLMRTAAAVITHAGVGSIMSALGVGVRPLIIARRSELGEHVDDHQLQITTQLAARGLVIPALDTDDIRAALGSARLRATWIPEGRLRSAAVEAAGDRASTIGADPPREVVHLGPTLAEAGGIASVISEYVDGDLGSWSARAVAVHANGSPLRRLALLLRASHSVLRLSPRRTAGVHVHVSQNFDLFRSLLLVFLARLRRLRAVATIHGSSFVSSAGKHPRVASWLVRSVAVVTALNEETVAAVRALGAQSVVSLPNPMSFTPLRQGVPRRTNTVLFAGDVGLRKGVDTLLAAWPGVHADHVDARLRLIGPVVDVAVLECTPPGVTVEGPQTRAFVRAALKEAAVAVLPSRAEALPMFLLEAMAAGIPVVATPVGAVADAVDGAGMIVPIGDHRALEAAISGLLGDPRRADALGRRGTAKARGEYGAATVLPKFAQLYASAFGPSGLVADGPR